jgi:hypothetical protein
MHILEQVRELQEAIDHGTLPQSGDSE